jgi:hypothetical protein
MRVGISMGHGGTGTQAPQSKIHEFFHFSDRDEPLWEDGFITETGDEGAYGAVSEGTSQAD